MTMGPAPMMRIDFRSVRLGTARVSECSVRLDRRRAMARVGPRSTPAWRGRRGPECPLILASHGGDGQGDDEVGRRLLRPPLPYIMEQVLGPGGVGLGKGRL